MNQHDEPSADLNAPAPLERISTGNQQADEILGGGFPVDSINVVMGHPGTGKTIFIEQLIFHNAGEDRPILYLTTMSEPLPKVVRYLQQFPFFDEAKIGSEVVYEDIGSELASGGIDALVPRIQESVKSFGPKIIVIDSFKAIHDLAPSIPAMRKMLYELSGLLSAYEATTFLVGEYGEEHVALLPEFAVADGIVQFSRKELGARDERYMRVRKLRGSRYREGVHGFRITDRGLDIYPRLVSRVPEDVHHAEGSRLLRCPRARRDARRRPVARLEHAPRGPERLGQDHARAPFRAGRDAPRRALRLRQFPGEPVPARLCRPRLRRRRRRGDAQRAELHLPIAGRAPDRQHPGRALPPRHRERHPPRGHRRHRRSRHRLERSAAAPRVPLRADAAPHRARRDQHLRHGDRGRPRRREPLRGSRLSYLSDALVLLELTSRKPITRTIRVVKARGSATISSRTISRSRQRASSLLDLDADAEAEAPRLRRLRKLTQVSRALTNATSLDQVLSLTVAEAALLLDGSRAALLLYDQEGQLQVRATHAITEELVAREGEGPRPRWSGSSPPRSARPSKRTPSPSRSSSAGR